MNQAGASSFLRQLVRKIADGKVILRQGGEELVLTLSPKFILEIHLEDENKGSKGIQHSLEIEIKWVDDDQGGEPVELG
jgi:amphi-Trp domain-containing protein